MNKKKMIKALKGQIVYSESSNKLKICENGYLVYEANQIKGVYPTLPEEYEGILVEDYGNRIIVPGFVDLHVHAPQYAFRGLGMDMELLDWLETNTFPEESKYKDIIYARKAYQMFVDNLKKSATTRACIFATIHKESTILLMDMLEKSGLATMVGKVNMDRNSPDYLREETEESVNETISWLEEVQKKQYQHTKPILTPRFIPSCTDELMCKLKDIQEKYQIPVQSHLSENYGEISWVQELCPKSEFYGDAYDQFGLFGRDSKTIMAHCVHSDEREIKRMKENGVFIAHCPESNTNLSSGVAPVRQYLEEGMHVGLGSDIAAGSTENMFVAMRYAIQASKLRWRLKDEKLSPLTMPEVFYMATKGGGEFFGKVGSFEAEYEMDAIVLDDKRLIHPQEMNVEQRLERMIYLADEREVYAKYVVGEKVSD